MLQKHILTFAVAFAVSVIFSLLSLMFRLGLLTSISPSTIISISAIVILTNAFFWLAVLGSFFAVFYFLSQIGQANAGKSTVFALLIGVLLGPLVIYQLLQMLYVNNAGWLVTTSIFMYFLPALTALFFVQWRKKQLQHRFRTALQENSQQFFRKLYFLEFYLITKFFIARQCYTLIKLTT